LQIVYFSPLKPASGDSTEDLGYFVDFSENVTVQLTRSMTMDTRRSSIDLESRIAERDVTWRFAVVQLRTLKS
jgi:hypothetical protein